MLVVPLLGFIFLQMGPVVVPISGTPGLAQEMGHPYLIWLDGAPKLEPFQGPKPKPQPHHKNESKGDFFSPPPPGAAVDGRRAEGDGLAPQFGGGGCTAERARRGQMGRRPISRALAVRFGDPPSRP